MYSGNMFLTLMLYAVPVMLVVLIVVLVEVSRLKREISELQGRQDDLEALRGQPVVSPGRPVSPQPVGQPGQPVTGQPAPQQPAPPPWPAAPSGQPVSGQPGQSAAPYPASSQFAPHLAPQRPAPQPQLAPQPQPAAPYPAPQPHLAPHPQSAHQPFPPPHTSAQPPSLETLFGRNVIGIVASVLVFFGLVFLGFLVVPLLTDALKIAALFLLSTLLVVSGFILNRRHHNNFTKALLGTGCGALFISIMLTHLWFHALNDLVALVLLLAWLALCFALTKATQSLLVAIVTHVGMVISVNAACLMMGAGSDRMMLVLAYQMAATAVIVVGNILCYRKTYRFGLYASLAVSFFASVVFWAHTLLKGVTFFSSLTFWMRLLLRDLGAFGVMPAAPDVIYFLTQFVGATVLAYLLLVSSSRVKHSGTQGMLQALTMLLWLGALTLDVGALIVWGMGTGAGVGISMVPFEQTSAVASLVLLVLVGALVLLTLRLRRALGFSQAMERATVCLSALYLCFLCFWRLLACQAGNLSLGAAPGLLYLVVPAVLLILVQRLTRDGLYGYLAALAIGIDAFFMVTVGYGRLEGLAPIGPSLGYLALMGVLLWLAYRGLPAERRVRHGSLFGFVMLVYLEVSLCAVALQTSYNAAFVLALLLCAAALGAVHFAGRDAPLQAYRVNEYALVLLAFLQTFDSNDDAVFLAVRALLVLACLALMLERVRQMAIRSAADLRKGRPAARSDTEAFTALAFFLLIVGTVNSLADWSELPYVLSLVCMVTALLVVALGFWSRARSLRLTGLVVLVACVLKLAVLDIGDVNSLMRVVAFIGGGVICFAISALYNFLVKLQGGRE